MVGWWRLRRLSAACGGGNRDAATSESIPRRRKLRFAVIPKSLDLPVFNYAKVGAERAAAELGNIEVIWRGPETADQLRQKEILESFITQRVDGIAISSLGGDFLNETINRAMDAGIPVVTWDSDAPNSKRIAYYGVDDRAAGRIMGEEAVRMLDGKGQVALITSIGAVNLARRLEGVQEVLAKHPGIKVVEVYDIKEDSIRVRGDHRVRHEPLSGSRAPGSRSAAGPSSRGTRSTRSIRRRRSSSPSTRSRRRPSSSRRARCNC